MTIREIREIRENLQLVKITRYTVEHKFTTFANMFCIIIIYLICQKTGYQQKA